jgi:hypothetical protein
VRELKPDKSAALLGMAFDNDDGHTRLTRGENFVLVGGSQDSHAMMQETAVKINERLDKEGKRLEDVSVRELRDICRDVVKTVGGKRAEKDEG